MAYHGEQREQSSQDENATLHTSETEVDLVSNMCIRGSQRDSQMTQAYQRLYAGPQYTNQDRRSKPSSC